MYLSVRDRGEVAVRGRGDRRSTVPCGFQFDNRICVPQTEITAANNCSSVGPILNNGGH